MSANIPPEHNERCGAVATSSSEQCKKKRFRGSRYCWSHLDRRTPFLLSVLGAFLISGGIEVHRFLTAPDSNLQIRGVLPVHLSDYVDPDGRFRQHQLAFIVKIENEGDAATAVTDAVATGCVSVDPFVAELTLPEGERLPSGSSAESLFERHKRSVMAIQLDGIVRNDSQTIQANGVEYVGVLFGLWSGRSGADPIVEGSVSVDGDCEENLIPSRDPSVSHLFSPFRVHYEDPEDIASAFRSGDLVVGLKTADNRTISVSPASLKTMRRMGWQQWATTDLSQLYELNYTGTGR